MSVRRLSLADVRDENDVSARARYDYPTILLAVVIYGSWSALLLLHDRIPWWILAPVAGYVVQWHSSLQHEAIHSFQGVPRWLRTAIVWPPIGMCLPFELFRRSHILHHRNSHLTFPGEDTESYYHDAEVWEDFGRPWRVLLVINQTFFGRVLIGPLLWTCNLYRNEAKAIASGDRRNVRVWIGHVAGAAAILAIVVVGFGMPAGQYLALFVYPGLMLGMMRSFIEHRWGERPDERTAVVESNWVIGLLFLFNNLHAVHHLFPSLPWYRIRRVWRDHGERIREHNGDFVFRGYREIARRWLVRPNFIPVHPPSRLDASG
jgi:fatty acid desaturase